MSEIQKIKIQKVGRQEKASKFGNGTYNITKVIDENTGRTFTAMGPWADNWKEGDEVDVIIGPKNEWTNPSTGVTKVDWKIENPNKTASGQRGGTFGPKKPNIVDAYTIAAAIAPVIFSGKDKVTLEQISKLADAVFVKLKNEETEKKEEVKTVDVTKDDLDDDIGGSPTEDVDLGDDIEDDDDDLF